MPAYTITEKPQGQAFYCACRAKNARGKTCGLRQSGSEVKLAPLKAVEGGENVV